MWCMNYILSHLVVNIIDWFGWFSRDTFPIDHASVKMGVRDWSLEHQLNRSSVGPS